MRTRSTFVVCCLILVFLLVGCWIPVDPEPPEPFPPDEEWEPILPVCNDGWCDYPEEDAFSCPEDCYVPVPYCGDGWCSVGESMTNCWRDCQPARQSEGFFSRSTPPPAPIPSIKDKIQNPENQPGPLPPLPPGPER